MAKEQKGDVLLFQTLDDGDISVVDGITEMTAGFETAAYLSLFGGNEADDGRPGNLLTWWGNVGETDVAKRQVSETQHLIGSIPATSSNLLKIEVAAGRDLQWFLDLDVASEVTVVATIPTLNRVNIVVSIIAEGEEHTFSFTENWKAAA